MSRLPNLTPDNLDDEQKRLYDAVAGSARAKGRTFPLTDEKGALAGPFNALLHAPGAGDAVQRLGAELRFASSLPGDVREAAILTVARAWRAEYEWVAHAVIARKEGVSDPAIDAIREGRAPEGDAPLALAHGFVTELLETRRVAEATYRQAVKMFGERQVVELVILTGYYGLIACVLNAFEIPVPEGQTPPFGSGVLQKP